MRLCAALLALLAASAAARTDVTTDNALDLDLEGYVYLRYGVYGQEGSIPDDAFELRRAGLKTDFALSSNLGGQLQVETRTDEIYLKDCYAEWEPADRVGLTLGLFKVPFCLNTLNGAWDLYSPEHSLGHGELSDLYYAGRDLGAMLSISPYGPAELMLCVSNGGPPEPEPEDRELQYTARAEAEIPGNVTLGLSGSRLRLGQEDPQSVEGYESSDPQMAWGVDARLSRPLSNRVEAGLTAEYLEADNWLEAEVLEGAEAPIMKDIWARGRLTWYPSSGGRVERIDLAVGYETLDTGDGSGYHRLLTPAVTIWPADTWRIRMAGMTHSFDVGADEEYTDIILELGAEF
ncbi:MAG: hypothetical protein R6U36_09010 [Candidatus Fermentibacteraceae bacterium]